MLHQKYKRISGLCFHNYNNHTHDTKSCHAHTLREKQLRLVRLPQILETFQGYEVPVESSDLGTFAETASHKLQYQRSIQ